MSYTDWTLSYKKVLAAFPKLPPYAIRYLTYSLGILGFLGFLDAIYLTIQHYKNAIPPCTLHGCEIVLTSQFSSVAGIPISLLGALYYLAVIILVGLLLSFATSTTIKNKVMQNIPTLLVLLTGVGLLIGIVLVIIQAFILHAFCQYCLASEVIDFLLFDCAWWLWRKNG